MQKTNLLKLEELSAIIRGLLSEEIESEESRDKVIGYTKACKDILAKVLETLK